MLLISENHKVIEIIVHGTGDIDRLYHSPHGVFLRRDGGVQKLGVAEVQEWSVQVSNMWRLIPAKGREWGDLQGKDQGMWWSSWFEYKHQLAQFVEHPTTDSEGPGSNPCLVRHYFSHPITFPYSFCSIEGCRLNMTASAWHPLWMYCLMSLKIIIEIHSIILAYKDMAIPTTPKHHLRESILKYPKVV